ncbi:MAG: hypothetical protein EOP80_06770 [Variovorax sp.]|nr:MAG: hypothetical protein EOP80_06770 [Variovorax sp.]
MQPRRRTLLGIAAAAALLVAVATGVRLTHWTAPPTVTAETLHRSMAAAVAGAHAPGQDPICVANGLAYDQEPVNVQLDNSATLAWMNMLVEAGLYAGPEEGSSGGALSQPIAIYRPSPELAQWGGARRLCVARAIRLADVSNLGPVADVRLRGKAYTGVLADVRWALDRPAPWLGKPGVGEALARELPSWRGARWQPGAQGWALTQRKSFVLVGGQWLPADAVERERPASARSGALPM